jgi:hypothetical protein
LPWLIASYSARQKMHRDWDDAGDSIVEHVAGIDDFEVAEATYRAAVARWPAARITLRQGARIVHMLSSFKSSAPEKEKSENEFNLRAMQPHDRATTKPGAARP